MSISFILFHVNNPSSSVTRISILNLPSALENNFAPIALVKISASKLIFGSNKREFNDPDFDVFLDEVFIYLNVFSPIILYSILLYTLHYCHKGLDMFLEIRDPIPLVVVFRILWRINSVILNRKICDLGFIFCKHELFGF